MKTLLTAAVLVLAAMLVASALTPASGMHVAVDGDDIGGPIGALFALLFAGGGILVAAVVVLCVGGVLALLFAGVGALTFGTLVLAAVVVALALSPLMMPLVLLGGLVWLFSGRQRR